MSSAKEEKVYGTVLRMVIWGEKPEDIFQVLEVNGFAGKEAKKLYSLAKSERAAINKYDYRAWRWWFICADAIFLNYFIFSIFYPRGCFLTTHNAWGDFILFGLFFFNFFFLLFLGPFFFRKVGWPAILGWLMVFGLVCFGIYMSSTCS